MKCLRIYASSDGESHFGEVDISTELTPLFPNEATLELSAYYEASRVRFVHIPAGMREAGSTRRQVGSSQFGLMVL